MANVSLLVSFVVITLLTSVECQFGQASSSNQNQIVQSKDIGKVTNCGRFIF